MSAIQPYCSTRTRQTDGALLVDILNMKEVDTTLTCFFKAHACVAQLARFAIAGALIQGPLWLDRSTGIIIDTFLGLTSVVAAKRRIAEIHVA